MPPDRVLGAVLAGGASSRFGSDKALAVIGGRTLLERARTQVSPMVADVVVVGRDGGVADLPGPGLGPLGGIAGALDHAAREGCTSVLTVGCDMPEIPAGLLAALLATAPAYCPDAPVLGHWPTALAAALIDRLSFHASSPRARAAVARCEGEPGGVSTRPRMPGSARHDGRHARIPALSIRRWAQEIGAVAIASPVPLRNVNTPADLPPP